MDQSTRPKEYQSWDRPGDQQKHKQQQQYTGPPITNSPKSPAGFWPNPDKELFYKTQTPPGEYQRGGKSRGEHQDFIMICQVMI